MRVLLVLAFLASEMAEPPRDFIIPTRAAPVAGPIGQAELSPIFREPFQCSEHFDGQIPFVGDALGSDCMITGGVNGDVGFPRLFRSDGHANEDWYGWQAVVLAPADAVVAGLVVNSVTNVPGILGRPPASLIQLRTGDGLIIVLAHIANPIVRVGDRVSAGQPIARIGNNGFARAPHIHIGAYREATAEPLQIRWDLRAMARLQSSTSPIR